MDKIHVLLVAALVLVLAGCQHAPGWCIDHNQLAGGTGIAFFSMPPSTTPGAIHFYSVDQITSAYAERGLEPVSLEMLRQGCNRQGCHNTATIVSSVCVAVVVGKKEVEEPCHYSLYMPDGWIWVGQWVKGGEDVE